MSNDTDFYAENGSSPGGRVVEAVLLCLIIAVCVVGNLSLWIVVLRSKTLRTVTSMFILGLSGADLFVSTINMPLTVYAVIAGYWGLSDDACVVFGFFNMLTLVTSVLSLCNISINRYFMVCKPNKFKDIYTHRNAVLMIIAVLTVAVLLSSPPLMGWCAYRYIPYQSFCFADWANSLTYAFFMIGCCFGIPLTVMTVCNIIIFRAVRKSRRRVKMVITSSAPKSAEIRNSSVTFDDSGGGGGGAGSGGVKASNDTRLTFSDVETFTENNDETKEVDLTESAIQNLQDVSESSDDPIFWEINDTYENGKSNNNNNFSESDSSTHEDKDKPWPERTLLKMETAFLSNMDIRTVSTHWADSTMIAKRTKDISGVSGESTTDSEKSHKTRSTVTPSHLHPSWKSKENKVSVSKSESTETALTTVDTVNITPDEPSRTSTASNVSITNVPRRRARLPRSASMRQREEVRLATTLAIVVIVFVMCWLPYCISMVLSIFVPDGVPRGFHMFTLLIGYANSGCNPIIYGVMNKRFKIGYQRLFCFCRSSNFNLNSDSPSH